MMAVVTAPQTTTAQGLLKDTPRETRERYYAQKTSLTVHTNSVVASGTSRDCNKQLTPVRLCVCSSSPAAASPQLLMVAQLYNVNFGRATQRSSAQNAHHCSNSAARASMQQQQLLLL